MSPAARPLPAARRTPAEREGPPEPNAATITRARRNFSARGDSPIMHEAVLAGRQGPCRRIALVEPYPRNITPRPAAANTHSVKQEAWMAEYLTSLQPCRTNVVVHPVAPSGNGLLTTHIT